MPVPRPAVALLVATFVATFVETLWPALAFGQETSQSAGRVKLVSGSASIVRGGQTVPASLGTVVLQGDVLRTGPGGQMSVILHDNTRLSLGAGSEIALAEFQFAPAESRLALVLRLVQGAMSYVSGRIAKLAPGNVRIETPTLVIGVRGTHALIKVDAP
jgi:hypothetical protein